MNEYQERRLSKAKLRQKHWQERQERSKLSRSEIEELKLRRADLRLKIDAAEENHSDTKVASEDESYTYFNQLPISQRTQMGLERGGYKKMTPIQSESLYLALAGKDVLGAAKTGSGKTLCFVIPVLESLFLEHWEAEDMGIGALVLSPTRELALQIFKVLQLVGHKHVLSAALLTGGRDVNEERKRLHAIGIVVGTPGRVLHHLQDDANLVLDNLQILCMDEADRLLDMGFREAIVNILRYLPTSRQTLLFSATQTTDVQMLAQMSLSNPRYVTSQAITTSPTPSTLCQNFMVIELHRKLDALLMFLKRHPNDKVVVFVSTCNQVKYMYLAFSKILKKMRIPSMCLTSKMKQFRREEVFLTFCRCKSAVLFCTDVASRGLDFPLVHWVVQYDCPDSAQTYIHRAGRTARAGARGVCLLMLTPRETPMLSYLANKKVPLREIAIKPNLMHVSQEIFVALVVQGLKYDAQKAFIAYLRSVYFASNKHVFDVASIDVQKFANSLGLLVVPDVSELQQLQRSAKNLPWDVVNYIAKRDQQDTKQLTRKEKHLNASDMFRMLEQKQRFAARPPPREDGADGADDEDDFLIKKSSTPAGEAMASQPQLTVDERLAGLSKNKKRKFIESADLRVRDLGLNKHVIFSDDDDDEEGSQRNPSSSSDDDHEGAKTFTTQRLQGIAQEHADGRKDGDSDGGESSGDDAFAQKLRQRISDLKPDDTDRARRLRRLRRLQRSGKLPRKATLESSGVTLANGGPKPNRDGSEGDEDDDDEVSSDGSIGRLIKAAKGELYSDEDEEFDRDEVEARSDAYHNIENSEDNESISDEDSEKGSVRPHAKKMRRE